MWIYTASHFCENWSCDYNNASGLNTKARSSQNKYRTVRPELFILSSFLHVEKKWAGLGHNTDAKNRFCCGPRCYECCWLNDAIKPVWSLHVRDPRNLLLFLAPSKICQCSLFNWHSKSLSGDIRWHLMSSKRLQSAVQRHRGVRNASLFSLRSFSFCEKVRLHSRSNPCTWPAHTEIN